MTTLRSRKEVVTILKASVSLEEAVVHYVQEGFWKTGVVPTVERISEQLFLDPTEVSPVLENEKVQAKLRSRGVPIDSTSPTAALTTVQQLAVEIMVNSADRRSERAKLDDLNTILKANELDEVTIHQWAGWKRQPAIQEALKTRAREMFSADEWKFHNALVQGTEERNPAIVKMMGQRLGLLSDGVPQTNVQVNLDLHLMIDKLYNVLTEVITDPELLARIGERLERELDEPGQLPSVTKAQKAGVEVVDVTAQSVLPPPETEDDFVRSLKATFAETPKSKDESRPTPVQTSSEAGAISQF
ncbi:MAG: hypothetical protein MN733_42640 [Nitrososphaera sp.]|nr:hypothetical protein [Nitrososphaera sp.]